jgi:hypothetical protein
MACVPHSPSRSAPSARAAALAWSCLLLAAALAGCGGSGTPAAPPGSACALPQASSLSVVQFDPPSGATGVFVGASITVRFNTCLDPATVTATNFLLAAGTSFVPRALSYDPATATVTIDPSGNLAYSTLHLVAVSAVRGAHGETMTGAGSSFQTQAAPEFVPPTTAVSPGGGRYNTPQSVALTCTDNPGGTGCAATYYTVNGSTPTALSTRYTVPIAIAADTTLRFFSTDVQGNAEAPRQEVYVIDTVPPVLTGSDPADGAAGVPVNKVLAATFSEEMNSSTLGPATVTADNGVVVTVSYAAGPPSTATIRPTERLACGTTYRVSIGAGATDVAGNALVQPATFSFTTSADCREPWTIASPPGGVFTTGQAVTLACDDGLGGSGCARIVYTTDGSVPSFDPPNGTVVTGASAGPIAVGEGDTVLRFFAEDAAGNREALRRESYSVSTTGFTFVGTTDGIARGVGPVPASFVPLRPGGRTALFHRDASNGRLYRGTERGLLVSDGGEAFSFLPGAPTSVISALAQGSKIFAGTGGNGLYVSLDGGGTFVQRDVGSTYAWVPSVVASGYRVWAASDAGVAVSADKGWTFALKTTADGLGSNSVRALLLDGTTLYAATANGVSISTDLGASFSNHTSGLPSPSVNAIAVSGSTVYAATDAGLAISSDGGQTFPTVRNTGNGLGSNYLGEIVFDGIRLYAGTGEPWISGASNSFSVSTDDTGATFTPHAVSPPHSTLRTESIHVEGTTVRVGAYPAYYLSTDGGSTFTAKDLRGSVQRITGLGSTLYAAISDGSGYGGLAISTDHGQSFTIRDRASGIPSDNVDDVAVASSGGLTYVYAATFSGLGISSDGGAAFSSKTVNPSAGSNVDCVWASGATVWACAGSTLNLSTNSGGNFTQRLSGTGSQNAVAVFGSNVYLAATDGLWVSGNGGTSWARRTTVEGLASSLVDDVAVDGNGYVLAATNNGLSRSLDSGATFAPAATPQIYASGVFAQGAIWYAAGYSGLSISQDGGASWAARGAPEGIVATARDAWYMP